VAVTTLLWSLLAVVLVSTAVRSAVATVVVPRGLPSTLTRVVFVSLLVLFRLRLRLPARRSSRLDHGEHGRRDRVLVFYAPVALLTLQTTWLLLVAAGFTAASLAQGEGGWQAITTSGSSLLTLGFDHPPSHLATVLSFVEAGIGLALLALLITYLPSLYAAFSRRERAVRKLEVRAGDPPDGVTLLERAFLGRRGSTLGTLWADWEDWFVDLEETHTSFASLAFFRSPNLTLSWITAAGAVLDAAALLLAVQAEVVGPDRTGIAAGHAHVGRDLADAGADGDPLGAEVCLRSGTLALQRVAAYCGVPLTAGTGTESPVRVRREEFADAFSRLRCTGLGGQTSEELAWEAFRPLRSRYDDALVGLAGLVEAPPAPWSSDRDDVPGRGRLRLRVRHISGDVETLAAPVLADEARAAEDGVRPA